jgi:prepilin-type N-terminal cleavage/methylation domain-containing protein
VKKCKVVHKIQGVSNNHVFLVGNAGFTLIELLIVMGIIGVLAYAALVNFRGQKDLAFERELTATLRYFASAEEAYFIDRNVYLTCSDATCSSLPGIGSIDPDIAITMTNHGNYFEGVATHRNVTLSCNWNSKAGGLQTCS